MYEITTHWEAHRVNIRHFRYIDPSHYCIKVVLLEFSMHDTDPSLNPRDRSLSGRDARADFDSATNPMSILNAIRSLPNSKGKKHDNA